MLRMPDGMRDRLKREADMNERSMNAEIVQRLKETLEANDMSRDRPRGDRATTVNLPESLRGRIFAVAEENERTLGSEIVYTLQREYPELAPVNDIVDMLNRSLSQARKRGNKRDLYELELAISQVYSFYASELQSDEINPRGDVEIEPLDREND